MSVTGSPDLAGTATTAPQPTARRTRALLSDGSPVLLARLGPEDTGDVLDLHGRLSERDRYLRFSTLHPARLEEYVRRTLSGAGGTLETLASLERPRKVLVHINNTNPILLEDSPERDAVVRADGEVAYDGLEVHL